MELDTTKLEEMMTEKGVESVDALLDAVKNEATAGALKPVEEQKASLKKQITDLETIKASQGDELGTLRKDLKEAKESLTGLGTEQMENANPAAVKTEADWAEENEQRLLSMSDEEVAKLNEAVGNNDALATIASTEEGKAGIIAELSGSAEQASQAIFYRPKQEKKVTVGEQIDAALGRQKPNLTPASRVSGSGFDPNRKPTETENRTKQEFDALPVSERLNAKFKRR